MSSLTPEQLEDDRTVAELVVGGVILLALGAFFWSQGLLYMALTWGALGLYYSGQSFVAQRVKDFPSPI